MIQVVLPSHLRTLARVSGDVSLEVEGQVTQRSILDALEARYPMLRGTIRDQVTQERRPFLRFFACEEDLSHELPDTPVPDAVASGAEPFFIIGAIAGGEANPIGFQSEIEQARTFLSAHRWNRSSERTVQR
jgi:sulfur-carrier protein